MSNVSLEDVLDKVGFTWYQRCIVVVIALSISAGDITIQSGAMLSATPKYRCKTTVGDMLMHSKLLEETKYQNLTASCVRSVCASINCTTIETDSCDNEWIFDQDVYEQTTVSQWNLVCGRRTLDSLANALFFVGVFFGSAINGVIANRYGRKKSLLFPSIFLIFCNVSAAFSPWFPMYVALRICAGICAMTLSLSGYTLIQELIPTTSRMVTSMAVFTITGISAMAVPGGMYAFKNWRYFYATVGAFGLPCLLLIPRIPESPRWLLLHGRYEEAKTFVQKLHNCRKSLLDLSEWNMVVNAEEKKINNSVENKHLKNSFLYLFRYPMCRIITLIVAYCWLVISMLYYGLILNITALAGNPYVNGTINSSMNLVAILFLYSSEKFGRRRGLFWSLSSGGVCCLLSILLASLENGENQNFNMSSVALAIIGKLFITVAYNTMLVVNAELYPTDVRSLGMSVGLMFAHIGSIIAPFTLQLQYTVPWLTQTILGVLSIIAGVLSLCLPETSNLDLITTLEEAEVFYLQNMSTTAKLFKIRQSKNGMRTFVHQKNEHACSVDKCSEEICSHREMLIG